MAVLVTRSSILNTEDSVKFAGKDYTFQLDEKNETDQRLILIYMYQLPRFPGKGIKVGMTICRIGETFWHAVASRIKDQDHELALSESERARGIGDEREVLYWGVCLDANSESFKDYRVHAEINSKYAGRVIQEQEWFIRILPEDLIDIFNEIRKSGDSRVIYTPRAEQQKAIDDLNRYFDEHPIGGRFLLNCKMRFGKCYTTYKFAEENHINKILILTFIPAVEKSWQDDLLHIKTIYKYYTDDNLKRKDFNLKDKKDPFVVFLSLQNYLGKDSESNEIKEKIQKLTDIDWDLLVLDEYHFGAWNQRTQGTIEQQEDLDKDYQKNVKEIKDSKDVVKKFGITPKKTICLSGTPFRALARGEFNDKTSSTYSYFDEQKRKYPNSENGDFSVVDPNYAMFPDMKIFGYNMKTLFPGLSNSVVSDDKLLGKSYFSLNKFFETKKDYDPNYGYQFIYEEEIKMWLAIIKGETVQGKNFPYSNPKLSSNNKNTIWLMPSVNSCIAMARLLKDDEFFNRYQIINLSDRGVGAGMDALQFLNDGMQAGENTGKLGSIAITVNKLTIGVTVKKWSSVFVLKDLASPESYFQSIFRIQTPLTKGDEILKKEGYVYDFNIDRAASLLLKYADESSKEHGYTKMQVAKLIVKYLPIFMNGDMERPIGEETFYKLAEFGDSRGKPLSKKIRDTKNTTWIQDEDTIAAMLNDPEVSDIIKHVFAHAKFQKSKDRNVPLPPEDGFKDKVTLGGRDLGYKLGMEDSKLYLDLDDNDVQDVYEANEKKHIEENMPIDLDEVHTKYFINGFKKGYVTGVNAPIKKMQCGKSDGLKFVDIVREQFGSDITFTDATKQKITDFIRAHLNNIENIPVEYRGKIYKRWYIDSFEKAVIKALRPIVKNKDDTSIEDTDNVMQHILARLFEFLYISVYRETTFDEIFKNADPNIFLEAVGITKKDFEVVNRYHIFKEDILNGFIREFFENESIGSTLDLTNEETRRNYRNSFDWFDYGIVEGQNVESEIPTQGQALSDYLRYQLNKAVDEIQKEEKELKQIDEEQPKEESATSRYYLAYGSNLNLEQMSHRCPGAKKIGIAIINDYRLVFKGSASGNYLTIERAEGYFVPVGVFAIEEADEIELDGYEGYPDFYYKKDFRVELRDENDNRSVIDAFAYIMHEERLLGTPTDEYLQRVLTGYEAFGFDVRLLEEAVEYSTPKSTKKITEIDDNIPLVDRILNLLRNNSKGLKSGRIAELLGVSKKEVNKVLYANKSKFNVDIFFVWRIKE